MYVLREFPQALVPGMWYFTLSQDPETFENCSVFLFVSIAGKLRCIFTTHVEHLTEDTDPDPL